MSPSEAAELLVLAQKLDGRHIPSEERARAWAAVMPDISVTDAAQAMRRHYRESRDMVMPKDLIDGTRLLRRERVAGWVEPALDPDLPGAEYAERLGRIRAGVASGMTLAVGDGRG